MWFQEEDKLKNLEEGKAEADGSEDLKNAEELMKQWSSFEKTDMNVTSKYTNTLPIFPSGLTFLKCSPDLSRYKNYTPSSLERQYNYDMFSAFDIRIDPLPSWKYYPGDEKLFTDETTTPIESGSLYSSDSFYLPLKNIERKTNVPSYNENVFCKSSWNGKERVCKGDVYDDISSSNSSVQQKQRTKIALQTYRDRDLQTKRAKLENYFSLNKFTAIGNEAAVEWKDAGIKITKESVEMEEVGEEAEVVGGEHIKKMNVVDIQQREEGREQAVEDRNLGDMNMDVDVQGREEVTEDKGQGTKRKIDVVEGYTEE